MDDPKTCYEILELQEGAPLDAVEHAHRELSRVWHPDRFSTDTPALQERARNRQQQINAAREYLVTHLAAIAATAGRADLAESPPTDLREEPAAAPAEGAANGALRRVGEIYSEYVAPLFRDLVVPAVVQRLTSREAGDGSDPRRRQMRDGSGGGRGRGAEGGRRGGGRGPQTGRVIARGNGSGRGRGGRRGQ